MGTFCQVSQRTEIKSCIELMVQTMHEMDLMHFMSLSFIQFRSELCVFYAISMQILCIFYVAFMQCLCNVYWFMQSLYRVYVFFMYVISFYTIFLILFRYNLYEAFM